MLSTMFEFILPSSNRHAVTRVFALGPDITRVLAFEQGIVYVWAVAFGRRRKLQYHVFTGLMILLESVYSMFCLVLFTGLLIL